MFKIVTLALSLLLSACMMVGPNYKEPKKPVDTHWKDVGHSVKESRIQNCQWWTVFRDPTLSVLIQKGYQQNPSLQSAGVSVLQTRAQLAQSVGELYPQQQALTGNYTYERVGGGSLQSLLPNNFDFASLGFSANWELDFWGKYRRAILSNDALFLASVAAYDHALVTLTSDIATAYVAIRTNEALIRTTQTNIALQAESLRIAQSRYRAGQTSLLDVEQAKTELAETQSTLPRYVSSLQMHKDALAVLLGVTPNQVDPLLIHHRGIPRAPMGVAVGIPKETLAHRPDIHQARLEAIAQSEAIGAIKANLFPSLSLAGTFTFSATNIGTSSISDMFNWQNRSASFGPNLSWPILNYGQITNAVRGQDAQFQQALLQYIHLVLKAQQEVQDNITQYIQSARAERYLATANISAISSTKLALIRYKEGESDYTTVLDAERQQLRVQTSLINAQGDVPKALIALYRSMGGGWQIRKGNDVISKQIKMQMANRTNWGSLLEQKNHAPPQNKQQQMKQLYLPNW